MPEVTVSPPGSIGRGGWKSALRHAVTGIAAGGVAAVMAKVGPQLDTGNVSVLMDFSTLKSTFLGAVAGGALRTVWYFLTPQTEVKPE